MECILYMHQFGTWQDLTIILRLGYNSSFITIQNKSKLDKQLEMSEGQLSITQTELALFCVWSHVLAQTLPKEL